MALFDDEQLYSDSATAPPMSPLVAPQPGVGLAEQPLASEQGFVPGSFPLGVGLSGGSPTLPAPDQPPRPKAPLDLKKEAIAGMTTGEKVFGALGEFGAALQGKSSPLLAQIEAKRKEKLLQLEEMRGTTSVLEQGIKLTEGLEGDARTKFIDTYATRLDGMDPGLGETYRRLSERPDLLTRFKDYEPYLSEPMKLMMKTNPKEFIKFAGTEGGQRALEKSYDQFLLNGRPGVGVGGASHKTASIIGNLQQLVSPEQKAKYDKDGRISISEFREINEELKAKNHPLALSDQQFAAAMRAGDEFFAPFNMLSPKKEQEVEAARAKDKGMKPGTMTEIPLGGKNFARAAYDPDKTLFPNAEHDANGFAILGKGTKDGTTINMPPTRAETYRLGADGKIHKIVIQIGADGKVRETDAGVADRPPGSGNPLLDEVAKFLSNERGNLPGPRPGGGLAPKPSAKPKPVPAAAVPAGIPAGSTKVGKSPDGKDVWQAPDGKKYTP